MHHLSYSKHHLTIYYIIRNGIELYLFSSKRRQIEAFSNVCFIVVCEILHSREKKSRYFFEDPSYIQGTEDPSNIQGTEDSLYIQGTEDPSYIQGTEDPSYIQGSMKFLSVALALIEPFLRLVRAR